MRFKFCYTGIRVRDLDGAISFFTDVLGMKLQGRFKVPRNKGEFANFASRGGKHWLEVNFYEDGSPIAGPFREGDELDHLGFEVDDFRGAIKRLREAGYPPTIGPMKIGKWSIAFVKGFEGIWLDVYHIGPQRKKRKTHDST